MANRNSQDGKRERIVKRLMDTFHSRLPEYGELAAIAKELGVSRQIVHAYFSNLQVHGRVYRTPISPIPSGLPKIPSNKSVASKQRYCAIFACTETCIGVR
ncbi:MAG: TetR/AcrR family transcriptional regulator [Candidatus Iainarchaeum archaeon]|uniref:TetR/AcrR family transcriptional regulator n=1 Tax=Candidatus Iainarchaeum sp. TaxID=3101447 RepID=A0A7T9DJ83_9ARCH|nr:MAG: TetR/AcrR family transcriptional regulator [Candidatus Diapherotrites archaeon]